MHAALGNLDADVIHRQSVRRKTCADFALQYGFVGHSFFSFHI